MNLKREKIKYHLHETDCDYCGYPLAIGDWIIADRERGRGYCSISCANQDAFERGECHCTNIEEQP
jgi:hypothetical protein